MGESAIYPIPLATLLQFSSPFLLSSLISPKFPANNIQLVKEKHTSMMHNNNQTLLPLIPHRAEDQQRIKR